MTEQDQERTGMTTRDWLNAALDHTIHLERGLALCCEPITDVEQIEELLRLKHAVSRALSSVEKLERENERLRKFAPKTSPMGRVPEAQQWQKG